MRPEKVPLLSPRKLEDFSALEFVEYVKSMRKIPESKTRSKLVEGINISNEKKLIVKIEKSRLQITLEEILALVQEFSVDKQVLIEKFQKRKLKIVGEDGNELDEYKRKPKLAPKRKTSTKRKKGNALNSSNGEPDSRPNQLVEPGPTPNLQEESGASST